MENKPTPSYVDHTPHAEVMLRVIDALQRLGAGWYGVSDVARLIGHRLYNSERGALTQLVKENAIEVRVVPSAPNSQLQRYEYRVVKLPDPPSVPAKRRRNTKSPDRVQDDQGQRQTT